MHPTNPLLLSLTLTLTPLLALSAHPKQQQQQQQHHPPRRALSPPFHLLAINPTSPLLHLQPINARRGGFYIGGGGPDSYCPQAPSSCPSVEQTGFFVAGGGAFLDVSVPGGQTIYVAPHGALSFTPARHPAAIPAGAATANFSYAGPNNNGGAGSFSFSGLGADALVACPGGADDDDGDGEYVVFANVTDVVVPAGGGGGGGVGACVGVEAAAYPYSYEGNVVAFAYV